MEIKVMLLVIKIIQKLWEQNKQKKLCKPCVMVLGQFWSLSPLTLFKISLELCERIKTYTLNENLQPSQHECHSLNVSALSPFSILISLLLETMPFFNSCHNKFKDLLPLVLWVLSNIYFKEKWTTGLNSKSSIHFKRLIHFIIINSSSPLSCNKTFMLSEPVKYTYFFSLRNFHYIPLCINQYITYFGTIGLSDFEKMCGTWACRFKT